MGPANRNGVAIPAPKRAPAPVAPVPHREFALPLAPGPLMNALPDDRDGGAESVIALIASHNRREMTLRALEQFFDASERAAVNGLAVLFDDGSTDGTSDHVSREFGAAVVVVEGDGTQFWASSMAHAERTAWDSAKAGDYLMWLNDDVVLDLDAVQRLVSVSRRTPRRVLVGSARDPETREVSYGGMVRSGRHPLDFSLVDPGDEPTPVDAMNGNIVLVPMTVARELGPIDGGFSHALADIDYAARAARLATPVLLAPGTYGTCARNPTPVHGSRVEAWRAFTAPKGGGNPRSTRRILRRLAPWTWPFWWSVTYGLWWARSLRR